MKYTSKLTKIGDSFYIIVPANIRNIKNLNKNSILEVDINEFIEEEKEIVSYSCLACQHYFDSDNNIPFCPVCGNENLMEIKNEKTL